MKFKYFSYEEFDSPDIQGSGQMMSDVFITMLDIVREEYGQPIEINSGFRTEQHNQEVGGVKNSSHLIGLAADLKIKNGKERFKLVKLLIKHGFNRIGLAKTFIHVDIDSSKTPNTIWTY